jgi:hypothetical protein
VRPLLPTDRPHEVMCVDALPYSNQIVFGGHRCFTLNYVLSMDCSQGQLFVTTVYPLISCVLEGNVNTKTHCLHDDDYNNVNNRT